MAALSDYLESGILTHLFRTETFPKPSNISIALTSSVPKDNDTGATIPELPTSITIGSINQSTNYARESLGVPAVNGNSRWTNTGDDSVTAFTVFTNDVPVSGYFYPLYLSSATATNNDTDAVSGGKHADEYTFSEYPGVSFFGPASLIASGESNPGYTMYEGNGFIKNSTQISFDTALTDWGWVSGVAILDSDIHGSGNLLLYAELNNPRYVFTGDSIKFDTNALEISIQ
jgi:hypothetical protein